MSREFEIGKRILEAIQQEKEHEAEREKEWSEIEAIEKTLKERKDAHSKKYGSTWGRESHFYAAIRKIKEEIEAGEEK